MNESTKRTIDKWFIAACFGNAIFSIIFWSGSPIGEAVGWLFAGLYALETFNNKYIRIPSDK